MQISKPRFEVGDRVRVVDTVYIDRKFGDKEGNIEDIYKLVIGDEVYYEYEIRFDEPVDNLIYGWAIDYDIIKIEEKPLKIYLASPFFANAGYRETSGLASSIKLIFGDKVDLYVPQDNDDINDKTIAVNYVTAEDIAKGDNYYLENADILIANLDGSEIDSGVSAEIGYIAGLNRVRDLKTYIIGYTTDMRINKTTPEVLEDIIETYKSDKELALAKVDNLKVNNLYKNLYTVGLVKTWGKYIEANNEDFQFEIIDTIKAELVRRECKKEE